MMCEKILSIIVPSYNMEKYLPKCLGSLVVAPRLMGLLEVLVVNDGSKDRTSEIAHEFAAKWPGTFKVIDKPNGHYGSCVNVGLAQMTGRFVKVLDADDWFDSNNFAGYMQWLETLEPSDMPDLILTDYDCYDEEGRDTGKVRQCVPAYKLLTLKDLVARGSITFMHGYTYRAELLRRIGYRQTEGIQYTDSEWIFEPAAFAEKIIYYPHVVYDYLFGREGQSVDPSVQQRCILQLEKVAVSVMSRYEQCKGKVSEDGRAYMMQLLERQLRLVYEAYLYFRPFWEKREDIFRFDEIVRMSCEDVYKRLDAWRIPRKCGIPWLQIVRKRKILTSLVMIFANCYRSFRGVIR